MLYVAGRSKTLTGILFSITKAISIAVYRIRFSQSLPQHVMLFFTAQNNILNETIITRICSQL